MAITAGGSLNTVPAPKKATPKKQVGKQGTLYTLDIGDDNWVKVLQYVADNKELGLAKIVAQLGRKYKVTAQVKKEITKQIKSK